MFAINVVKQLKVNVTTTNTRVHVKYIKVIHVSVAEERGTMRRTVMQNLTLKAII
jgi:hypothetical protein